MTPAAEPVHDLVDFADDRSPAARLHRATTRIAYLEGQIEVLREQVATLEAADEHRRAELAAARAEAAEGQAAAREAQARAEERRHLIEELRSRLERAQSDVTVGGEGSAAGPRIGWRRRVNRTAS